MFYSILMCRRGFTSAKFLVQVLFYLILSITLDLTPYKDVLDPKKDNFSN